MGAEVVPNAEAEERCVDAEAVARVDAEAREARYAWMWKRFQTRKRFRMPMRKRDMYGCGSERGVDAEAITSLDADSRYVLMRKRFRL